MSLGPSLTTDELRAWCHSRRLDVRDSSQVLAIADERDDAQAACAEKREQVKELILERDAAFQDGAARMRKACARMVEEHAAYWARSAKKYESPNDRNVSDAVKDIARQLRSLGCRRCGGRGTDPEHEGKCGECRP